MAARAIGLVGGTGNLGPALALHLSMQGHYEVVIGSREKEKAESKVASIISEKSENHPALKDKLRGDTNDEVVSSCDVVIVTVPAEAAVDTMKNLSKKFSGNDQLVVSTVAPLSKIGNQFLPSRRSPAISKMIEELLPKSIKVATAFQTIPAPVLYKEMKIDADVPVACDNPEVYSRVAELVSAVEGLRPLYVGTLELAPELESLTAILLNIGIKNKLKSPTFKIHTF